MNYSTHSSERRNTTNLRLRNRLLISGLILVNLVLLTACSQSHRNILKPGLAGYDQYPDGGGLFVSATFGPDGRLWRIVPEKHHVYVDYSTDLGKTFSSPVLINKEAQRIKVSGENRLGIAVDSYGRIYIIYAAEGDQPVVVYFSVSTDHGQSFSIPTPLSDGAAEANSFQASFALSPSGKVYAFWHDERDRNDWRQTGNAIYYTSIEPNGQIPPARKLADRLCECCRIAADFDKNGQTVVLARFIYSGSIRDHGLIVLQTNGKPELQRATYDQWKIEACPEHGPAMTIGQDNNYHIVWFTLGSVRQGLFYAHSSDQGKHFSEPMAVGNPDKLASHPDILARGKRIVIAWNEFDGVTTQLKSMQSHDNGISWSTPSTLATSSAETDFPFLLSKGKAIFVSWNNKSDGYRLIAVE